MRSTAELMLEERPAASFQPAATMADTESGGPGGGSRPGPRKGPAKEDSAKAFDIWLQRGLHQLYDSVAKEPIPDELLKLIEQDKAGREK